MACASPSVRSGQLATLVRSSADVDEGRDAYALGRRRVDANLLLVLSRLSLNVIHQQRNQAVKHRVHVPIGLVDIVERDLSTLMYALLVTARDRGIPLCPRSWRRRRGRMLREVKAIFAGCQVVGSLGEVEPKHESGAHVVDRSIWPFSSPATPSLSRNRYAYLAGHDKPSC
jgi:hypothetical protein